MRDGRAAYWPSVVETLVPLLQGVLRTYRHFLAHYLAPPPEAADYGQLTVIVGSLGGAELPFWLSNGCDPYRFMISLAQWAPILDTPPIAAAVLALREQQATHALFAAAASTEWAQGAYRSWTSAIAEEERQVTAVGPAPCGLFATPTAGGTDATPRLSQSVP